MENKAPLKLKLKLGGSSTPEPGSPTGGTQSKMSNKLNYLPSDEDEDDTRNESQHDASLVNEPEDSGIPLGTEDSSRERHKKSKKKKKKKDKDREKHKHKHHRERNDFKEDGPLPKKACYENPNESSTSNILDDGEIKAQFKGLLEFLVPMLQKRDPQGFFSLPVTDAIAPSYSSIINTPMDFSEIRKKISEGSYPDLKSFTHDVRLICNNCMMYNNTETIYYKAAKKLLHGSEKILEPQRVAHLKKDMPSILTLPPEILGFDIRTMKGLSIEEATKFDAASLSDSENSQDAQRKFSPMEDDLTPEELLEQAQRAAKEAADKLTLKKPASALGFLRQRKDGTTTLNFLSGCEGNNTKKEKIVNLGLMTGKLPQGTTSLNNYRDDKRSMAKPVKPLTYESFSSFCPSYDSTFANITKEESEMIYATYGNETAVQYAESICDFSRDCDMAMHLVDQLLNLLTHDQHSRTKAIIEERKRVQREEQKVDSHIHYKSDSASKANDHKSCIPNFDNLRSLSDLGIDTSFLRTFENLEERESQMAQKLGETGILIETLAKEQKDRLSRPLPASLNNVSLPSATEIKIADKLTEGLASIASKVTPGSLAPVPIVRRALGITLAPVDTESKGEPMDVDNSFMGENSAETKSFNEVKAAETDTDVKLREMLRN